MKSISIFLLVLSIALPILPASADIQNFTVVASANNAEAYFNEGVSYFNQEQYMKAVEAFTHAINLAPKSSAAYYNRGNAYFNLAQYTKAIYDHTQAISMAPKNAKNYISRGNDFFALKLYAKAIQDYTQAITLDSKLAEAYNNRGVTYNALGQYTKSVNDCTQAIYLDPKYANAYNNRGEAYYALNQYATALNDYTIARKLDPTLEGVVDNLEKTQLALQKKAAATNKHHPIASQEISQSDLTAELKKISAEATNLISTGLSGKVPSQLLDTTKRQFELEDLLDYYKEYILSLKEKDELFQTTLSAFAMAVRDVRDLGLLCMLFVSAIPEGLGSEVSQNMAEKYRSKYPFNLQVLLNIAEVYLRLGKKTEFLNIINLARQYRDTKSDTLLFSFPEDELICSTCVSVFIRSGKSEYQSNIKDLISLQRRLNVEGH